MIQRNDCPDKSHYSFGRHRPGHASVAPSDTSEKSIAKKSLYQKSKEHPMQHATREAILETTTILTAGNPGIPDGKVPDFRLQKQDEGGWQVRVVSTRGSYWLRANHLELCDQETRIDLSHANAFLREARKNGFKTEYIGPKGSAII
ncbi:hypothetical protein [Rhizobium leguminosarum]|uniref:hypothetical protein n=2 Tax=Rhizobium TaxID=379 RepID=UPI001FD8C0EE|nr:hypothetical protein [Rhizobium leguminosarum]